MKGQFSKLWLLTIAVIISVTINAFSQPNGRSSESNLRYEKNVKYVNGYRVIKGERPPIKLEKVPTNAYESGKLLIKFNPEMNKFLETPVVKADQLEYVQTGNPKFDKLNKEYGITTYKQTLNDLYSINPNSKSQNAKHKAWGFDLWYELTLDKNSDIKQAVADFNSLEEVEIAEPIYKKRRIEPVEVKRMNASKTDKSFPNDDMYGLQWGLKNSGQPILGSAGVDGVDIAAEAAWEIEKGNPSVIVSIHDGGIQYDHPDIAANMWPNIGPDGLGTNADDHGTHVGGTIAAVTNNQIGVAGIAGGDGTEKGVQLMSLDIFSGSLSTYAGYVYAADNGSSISQNSWGYQNPGVYNSPDLAGIDYFNENGGGSALSGGGIVIFAAGNDNDFGEWYPGYYSGTMAVASHTNKGTRSSFSNYGTWVDISAPGSNIGSTATNNRYVYMSGTSMACPHVSGVASLVVSKYYGEITKSQLWNAMLEGVEDIYLYNSSMKGMLGTGRTSAHKALIEASRRYFPKIQTANSTDISAFGAAIGGEILRDGGYYITAKGVVWSKTDDPTLDNCEGYTNEGGGSGVFTSTLTNLEPNTQYYARAYATNSQGTSYGKSIVFQTFSEVTFRVVDESRNPIENATIQFDGVTGNTNNEGYSLFYKQRGSFNYYINANGYEATGGKAIVGSDENSVKVILISENSTGPSIIGESYACINSEVIYHITNIPAAGNWEVEGGSVISTPNDNSVIAGWAFSIEDRIIRYRVVTDDNYFITYQKNVTVDENKIIPTTDKPSIHKKGNIPILICTTPELEYKWYKDGILIDGQTEQHFAPRNQPGSYQVQITDHRQCPNTSNATEVVTVMQSGTLSAYPNPTNGALTLDFASETLGNGIITVANSHGEVVFQKPISKAQEILSQRVNLSELPKGIYIVRISIGNEAPVTSKISIY
jgi:subtilisin family serine protease